MILKWSFWFSLPDSETLVGIDHNFEGFQNTSRPTVAEG